MGTATAELSDLGEGPGPVVSLDRPRPRLGRRYWSLWTASTISSVGDGLALVAFPLLATRYTTEPMLIAGVAVAQHLPWLLCSLVAGSLADRLDRRRVLVVVEMSRMVVVIALAATIIGDRGGLGALYLAAFVLGTFETGFSAAALGATPALVRTDDLDRANGYLYAGQTAGEQFIGPALGGAVFAAGVAIAFVVDGVSFALSALLISRALRSRREPARGDAALARPSLMADIRVGLRWFAASPSARSLAGILASLAFCQAMVLSVLVLLCVQTLHLSPIGYGLFLAVGAAGNLAGGAIAGRVRERLSTRQLLIGGGLAAAGAYAVVAVSPNATIAALAFTVEAVAVALGNVASVSLRQRLIPHELLGRVGNLLRSCIFGAMPLGALAAGLLAQHAGVRTAILAAAIAQAVLVMALRSRVPDLDGSVPVTAAH